MVAEASPLVEVAFPVERLPFPLLLLLLPSSREASGERPCEDPRDPPAGFIVMVIIIIGLEPVAEAIDVIGRNNMGGKSFSISEGKDDSFISRLDSLNGDELDEVLPLITMVAPFLFRLIIGFSIIIIVGPCEPVPLESVAPLELSRLRGLNRLPSSMSLKTWLRIGSISEPSA